MSIVSTTLSTTSGNSLKQTIREKLNEIETYRELLYNQIDALQKFFDACADKNGLLSSLELDNGLRTYDFKGEVIIRHIPVTHSYLHNCFYFYHLSLTQPTIQAITFRETTSGFLMQLNNCVEQITQKEEKFKKKLDKEIERRKKLEEELKYV
jgi:collagen type IV alpha-3-binding protein